MTLIAENVCHMSSSDPAWQILHKNLTAFFPLLNFDFSFAQFIKFKIAVPNNYSIVHQTKANLSFKFLNNFKTQNKRYFFTDITTLKRFVYKFTYK